MTDEPPGRHWRGPDGVHVDTRGLSPPDPLVSILWHVERPGERGPVTVYLDRNPVHLYPELAERGWTVERLPDEPGTVRLVLRSAR